MPNGIEQQFDQAMINIYIRAKDEAQYNANRFLEMLHQHRGLQTAQILLHSPNVSGGYTALWERKRLDLTVEALILQPEWEELFTDEDRNIARERLQKFGYDF